MVHKKCSGIKGNMVKVIKSFTKFCYLGDMLSVEGDADAAVEARIRVGWNKFRQLVPLLNNKDDDDDDILIQ